MSNGQHGLRRGRTRGRCSPEGRRIGGASARRQLAVLLAVAMVAVACATQTADDASTSGPAGETSGRQGTGRDVIRFAFAPDPVWDYMRDTGVLAEWEEEHNLRIHTSESWDEFTYFAAGHGNIVSMGTYELPLLEQETGVKVVAFGQYNHARGQFLRRSGDLYETLTDVPRDATVCVGGAVENTIDSVIANQMHGVDFRVGEGEFANVVVQDWFVMHEMVARGECDVASTIPEGAVGLLRGGELEPMYDGRSSWQLYKDEVCECDHKGIMSNLFVATEEWYDAHPDQAAAFLELWERGLQLWEENKDEIVGLYPQHFSVESEEDIEWMVDYMQGPSDWFADTVYMDAAWIEEETKFYEYMIDSGWMEAGTEIPRFVAVPPPT